MNARITVSAATQSPTDRLPRSVMRCNRFREPLLTGIRLGPPLKGYRLFRAITSLCLAAIVPTFPTLAMRFQ
jgi:hypothetical protein